MLNNMKNDFIYITCKHKYDFWVAKCESFDPEVDKPNVSYVSMVGTPEYCELLHNGNMLSVGARESTPIEIKYLEDCISSGKKLDYRKYFKPSIENPDELLKFLLNERGLYTNQVGNDIICGVDENKLVSTLSYDHDNDYIQNSNPGNIHFRIAGKYNSTEFRLYADCKFNHILNNIHKNQCNSTMYHIKSEDELKAIVELLEVSKDKTVLPNLNSISYTNLNDIEYKGDVNIIKINSKNSNTKNLATTLIINSKEEAISALIKIFKRDYDLNEVKKIINTKFPPPPFDIKSIDDINEIKLPKLKEFVLQQWNEHYENESIHHTLVLEMSAILDIIQNQNESTVDKIVDNYYNFRVINMFH